jgi:hypothetical protein
MAATALLTSKARTATANAEDIRTPPTYPASGVMLILDITAAPATVETLTVSIQVKDPISGKYVTVTAFAATKKGEELGAGTTLAFSLYPGASETAAVANHEVQALPVPTMWRAVVTPSAAGSWTYSLSYQTLQ